MKFLKLISKIRASASADTSVRLRCPLKIFGNGVFGSFFTNFEIIALPARRWLRFLTPIYLRLVLAHLFLFAPSALAYQILQKNKEVTIVDGSKGLQEINVGETSSLKFIDGNIKYDLFGNTKIIFAGEFLELKSGDARIRPSDSGKLVIQTPVGVLTLNGSDFLVHYQADRAIVAVEVLGEGHALLQGHYREEILNVQKGERGSFVGVPEVDGPAYDVLLKGRKAVRGNMVGPEKMTSEQVKVMVRDFDIGITKMSQKLKPKPKAGQICAEPFAKFNECVWRCKNNPSGSQTCIITNPKVRCLREKCFANGRWGDSTVLSGTSAQACVTSMERVGPCDY